MREGQREAVLDGGEAEEGDEEGAALAALEEGPGDPARGCSRRTRRGGAMRKQDARTTSRALTRPARLSTTGRQAGTKHAAGSRQAALQPSETVPLTDVGPWIEEEERVVIGPRGEARELGVRRRDVQCDPELREAPFKGLADLQRRSAVRRRQGWGEPLPRRTRISPAGPPPAALAT